MSSDSANVVPPKVERTAAVQVTAFSVVLLIFIGGATVSLLGSLPTTVLTPEWSSKQTVQRLLPQSWAFFTRDPKTASLILFADDPDADGTLARIEPLPQSRRVNMYGFSRTQRSADTEKAAYSASADLEWTDCRGLSTADCFESNSDSEPRDVPQVERGGAFCGTYRLARVEPVPFAFREQHDSLYTIEEMTRIEITC